MLRFAMRICISATAFASCEALLSSNLLKCVPMRNEKLRVRPAMVNVNSNEPLFYPYSVIVNVVAATMILITYMLNYALFLILLKT